MRTKVVAGEYYQGSLFRMKFAVTDELFKVKCVLSLSKYIN